jgi:AAA15 family ATPase/GTPase
LFQSPAVNSSGAQLVFTTHDTTLMTPALFRRDQVWLVEKDPSGASQLKSLYDFKKPRSSESFQRNYLAGRYGAVPNLGPAFEDLEIK